MDTILKTKGELLIRILDGSSYDELMESSKNATEKGFIFESVVMLMMSCNMFSNFTGNVQIGNFSAGTLRPLTDISEILGEHIRKGGDKSDITIINNTNITPISIKYRENITPDETDIQKLADLTTMLYPTMKFNPGLILKSKSDIINHIYKFGSKRLKELHTNIISNKKLLDEDDIKCAYTNFQQLFAGKTLKNWIEIINIDILKFHKKPLHIRLHQQMTMLSITRKVVNDNKKRFIIGHKPRSGKSITTLLIISELIRIGQIQRCLFITSVPDTIDDFIKTIRKYYDFKILDDSKRIDKDEIESKMDDDFTGIIFGGTQFLKLDKTNTKKYWLVHYNPDAIVIDESQYGGSTIKTKHIIKKIINNKSMIDKLLIYVSATYNKTKQFYGISRDDIYDWTFMDEAYMKNINQPSVMESMISRHGSVFEECLTNKHLNIDYSSCPIPILNRPEFPKIVEDEIMKYNLENNTNLGFDLKSIFALEQSKKTNGNSNKFSNKFQLENSLHGIKLLKGILSWIISDNPNENSIMRQVQECQSKYNSRVSTGDSPFIHIMFLPKVGAIHILQETIIRFLNEHNLWSEYRVIYSNANSNTGNMELCLTEYINKQLETTKSEKKDGLIVLLGDQGSLGITLDKCDTVFMFDNSTDIDYYFQRIMRCMTEGIGKTIGCIVDLNVQRTLLFLKEQCKMLNTNMTYSDAIYKLLEMKVFLFNPKQYNFGNMDRTDISAICSKLGNTIVQDLQEDTIFDSFMGMKDDIIDVYLIKTNPKSSCKTNVCELEEEINIELGGKNMNLPKGGMTAINITDGIRPSILDGSVDELDEEIEEPEDDVEEIKLTSLDRLFRQFVSILSLLTRTNDSNTCVSMYNSLDENKQAIIKSVISNHLNNKEQIDIITMRLIELSNQHSYISDIKEIYKNANGNVRRELVAKHFTPSAEEHKNNAEIPTSVPLVDEMLDIMPIKYWTRINKTFEPCCGKGNFVLGIFHKLNKGLSKRFKEPHVRMKHIIERCIYFADLSNLNVAITTELLLAEAETICGHEMDYKINSYCGDTLTLDINDVFGFHVFDAVIGNPPYSTDPSKPNTKPLYDKFIEKYINAQLLLFVVPSRWFVGGKGLDRFRKFMIQRKDIVRIQHEDDATKWFGSSVEIKGGVSYFLKDASYHGLCSFNGEPYDLSKYECIIKPKYHTIIDIVKHMESINTLCMGRCFGIETNDTRLKNVGKTKCYVSTLKSKDRCKYIDDYEITEKHSFWKVITPEAAFKAFSGFGEKFIGTPDEIHTGSYISFRVNTEDEAKSLLSYLETKFANHMLSIRKISQHINEDVCKWIPLVPFDRIWTDDKVCEYLNIDQALFI
jgi:site-specific DNA-methyltransferase (adenine-specific)